MSFASITLPTTHPFLAATAEELARLRAALRTPGPAGDAVRRRVQAADEALATPLVFPPRGGQHNQWYQCDACQLALVTVDDTHHRCPRCGAVYTGEPYDDVIFARIHGQNLHRMCMAAWAYALTGAAHYADDAKRVLLGYSTRYRQYPYHSAGRDTDAWSSISGGHIAEQTLNESAILADQIAPAVDLIWTALTAAEQAAICDGLIRPMLEQIDANKAGKSNWQSWHNAGLFAGAALLGDAALARRTIDDPHHGFLSQMRVSISADGMWYENSWSYHAFTLSALVSHAEAARRCGLDLWAQEPLRKMFRLPLAYVMPDGSLPRFGDAVGSAAGAGPHAMEAAYHALREDGLLAMLPETPSWESVLLGRDVTRAVPPPALTSRNVAGAGHVLLRAAGPAGLAAALTYGPYGGFHGHFDKLSFVFFGYGRELGVDPGRAHSQAYRLPIHTHWYKATLSHNAVLVDGQPQQPAEGQLPAFTATDRYAVAVASCDTAYPGIAQRRLLCLTPTYLLVLDDLAAAAVHRFDWVYHARATGVTCAHTTEDTPPEAGYPGQEFLQHLRRGVTDAPVCAAFDTPGLTTALLAAAAPGTTVRTGDGPVESITDRAPLLMLTRTAARTCFAVVLEPTPAAPAVRAVTLDERGADLVIHLRNGDAEDLVTLTADNRVTVTHDGQPVLASQ